MKKCLWKKIPKDGYFNYLSGCRIESGSYGIGWKFCPYCGKPLVIQGIKKDKT